MSGTSPTAPGQVRPARLDDLDDIADLAAARRALYATYQPVFWRVAADAVAKHRPFLASLIERDDAGAFVWDAGGAFGGYLFASLVPTPPVYDPGGPSCYVDDFATADPDLWPAAGPAMLDAAAEWGRSRGAAQLVVVCGERDEPKSAMLDGAGLSVASTWWTQPLD